MSDSPAWLTWSVLTLVYALFSIACAYALKMSSLSALFSARWSISNKNRAGTENPPIPVELQPKMTSSRYFWNRCTNAELSAYLGHSCTQNFCDKPNVRLLLAVSRIRANSCAWTTVGVESVSTDNSISAPGAIES